MKAEGRGQKVEGKDKGLKDKNLSFTPLLLVFPVFSPVLTEMTRSPTSAPFAETQLPVSARSLAAP